MLIGSEDKILTTIWCTIYRPLPSQMITGERILFPTGSKVFCSPSIFLQLYQILPNIFLNYLFKFLPYSLRLIGKLEVLKELGYLWHMHTRNQKIEKLWETPLHFQSSKRPKAPWNACRRTHLKHKGSRYNKNNIWRKLGKDHPL